MKRLALNLLSLEARRIRGDMITILKFLMAYDDVNTSSLKPERLHNKRTQDVRQENCREGGEEVFSSTRVVDTE